MHEYTMSALALYIDKHQIDKHKTPVHLHANYMQQTTRQKKDQNSTYQTHSPSGGRASTSQRSHPKQKVMCHKRMASHCNQNSMRRVLFAQFDFDVLRVQVVCVRSSDQRYCTFLGLDLFELESNIKYIAWLPQ